MGKEGDDLFLGSKKQKARTAVGAEKSLLSGPGSKLPIGREEEKGSVRR